MESQAFVPRLIRTDSDPEKFAEDLTPVTGPIRFSPAGRRFCGSAKVVDGPIFAGSPRALAQTASIPKPEKA